MQNGEFITVKEAATYLGVHVITMYRYAKMPAHKGGPPKRKFSPRNIRFPRQQFLIWAGLIPEKKNV